MSWDYSDKTKQIFMDAVQGKPGTHLGEIENADGIGEHGSIACGDALRFTFRVDRDANDPLRDVIVEARYLTFGCTSAIAASEALCAIIENGNYTPVEALKITNRDIVDYLEGLPDQKIHCSVMGAEALEAAVFNWAQRRGVDLESLGVDIRREEQEEGKIVCQCFTLSEPYLRRKVKELGLKTIPEITNAVKAGGACMSCHHIPGGLQDILDDTWGRQPTTLKVLPVMPTPREVEPTPERPEISPFQFAKKVEKALDDYVRPLLKRDDGDLDLLDIKGTLLYVRFTDSCDGCTGSDQTKKLMVERTLKEMVDDRIRVITV